MTTSQKKIEQQKRKAAEPKRAVARILVVEDEPSVRRLVQHFLSAGGYDVAVAANPFEALQAWKEANGLFDLIVTDVIMPGAMSGSALAARLQQEQPRVQVLFTSGYSSELLVSEGTLVSGVHFLQKPYHPDMLLDTVRGLLAAAAIPNQMQKHYAQTTSC